MDMIKAEDIHVSFKNLEVLKGVSLSVKPQEVVCIIGPSGAGKSTFLRALNHLEHIKNGKIYIEDQLLTHHENGVRKLKINSKKRREILLEVGMVFQRFNLFPHKTALENIMIAPVTVLKKSKQEAREKGIELLNRVGLGDKINEYPSKLSGGQQQRVSIARALALKPEVLLFDEPTSALDPELTGEILAVIKDLAAEKMTMAVVTHEMAFARDISDYLIFMDGGLVIEEGKPEAVINNPQNERTKAFLSRFANA